MNFYVQSYQPVYYSNVPYPLYVYPSYGYANNSVPFVTNDIPQSTPTVVQPTTLEETIKQYAVKTRQSQGNVISQLSQEFDKYVHLFTYQSNTETVDDTEHNSRINNNITLLQQSANYLKSLRDSSGSFKTVSSEQESSSPRPKKRVKNNSQTSPSSVPLSVPSAPPRGVIIEKESNGNVIYKVDGKPIKFKVVKNRPKNGAFNNAWEWHFQKLVAFKNTWGHTNVTRSVEGYEDIGTWVAEQRRKIKKGRITWDQFEKLNQIGFEWDRSHYFYNTLHKKSKTADSPEESAQGYYQVAEEQIQPLEEGEESDRHTDPEIERDDNNMQLEEEDEEEQEEITESGQTQTVSDDNHQARSQEAPDTALPNA